MKNLPVRQKLLLLVGVPVLGAIALSFLIVTSANEQVRKAESLGSVESLAELSNIISVLVHELQRERAEATRVLGKQHATVIAEQAAVDPVLDELLQEAEDDALADEAPANEPDAVDEAGSQDPSAAPSAGQAQASPARRLPSQRPLGATEADKERLARQFARTDESEAAMAAFLSQRDLSRLPKRLSTQLSSAQQLLDERSAVRASVTDPETALSAVTKHYDASLAPLIQATAALTELVDDGELLRLITSLVALMKVKEANAAEHAVVVHALSAGEFAPGAYRQFVALTTASESYADVFRTLASQAGLLDVEKLGGQVAEALEIRKLVSNWLDGPAPASADRWFDAQAAKLNYMRDVEKRLNDRVRDEALSRIDETRQALAVGVGLAALVLLVSSVLGWFVSVGVLRSVAELRAASERIGHGDLSTHCEVDSRDELGQLGDAFNEMAKELAAARQAEANQARMARELEIAAQLQSALLPPNPRHPGFEFAGRMIPAEEVGGDFYDVQSQGEGNDMWLTIGDVSNHGLDSGLVMLMAQSAFATEFQANPDAPADTVLRGVNRVLWENITSRLEDNKYVTAQLLQHRGNGRFDCAGGHEPPIVFRKQRGDCDVLSAIGPWLGITGKLASVPVSHIDLDPGDVLCLYSDGVTEAKNENGELFDTARLAKAMAAALHKHVDLEHVADYIIDAVRAHAAGRDDDWTMLLVRRAA